ncbi:unnamed protein product [Absidia cylindrospora]
MSPKSRRVVDQDDSKLKTTNDDGTDDNNKSTAPATSTTTTFDHLTSTLLAMNQKFTTMNYQFQQLKKWPKTSTRLDIEKYKTQVTQVAQVAQAVGNSPKKPTEDQVPKKPSPLTGKTGSTPPTKDKKIAKKGRKFVSKININNIIAHLPLKYREQTEHMKTMETVLRVLRLKPEGMTMATMVREIGLPQYRVTDCLNALVRSKDVQKFNPKGQLAIYQMDPAKFASH